MAKENEDIHYHLASCLLEYASFIQSYLFSRLESKLGYEHGVKRDIKYCIMPTKIEEIYDPHHPAIFVYCIESERKAVINKYRVRQHSQNIKERYKDLLESFYFATTLTFLTIVLELEEDLCIYKIQRIPQTVLIGSKHIMVDNLEGFTDYLSTTLWINNTKIGTTMAIVPQFLERKASDLMDLDYLMDISCFDMTKIKSTPKRDIYLTLYSPSHWALTEVGKCSEGSSPVSIHLFPKIPNFSSTLGRKKLYLSNMLIRIDPLRGTLELDIPRNYQILDKTLHIHEIMGEKILPLMSKDDNYRLVATVVKKLLPIYSYLETKNPGRKLFILVGGLRKGASILSLCGLNMIILTHTMQKDPSENFTSTLIGDCIDPIIDEIKNMCHFTSTYFTFTKKVDIHGKIEFGGDCLTDSLIDVNIRAMVMHRDGCLRAFSNRHYIHICMNNWPSWRLLYKYLKRINKETHHFIWRILERATVEDEKYPLTLDMHGKPAH